MSEFENNKIAVTHAEISNIESYIQEKNTAVLTIMFTDIKGFTELTEQKGEQYATEFRKQHDAILKQIIEADKAGLIIKFIGDAVMAVFSEPSIAVECALKIQQTLDEFNQQQNFEPIKVRIGLHMGQVSIANSLQADVFGRHVNRASRIESLADAGQIYLSYTVFDSAKGWLKNNTNIVWQSHGFYRLKGIDEPVEIYEVIAKQQGKPKAPLKGNKQRSFKWLFMSILVLITALITATIFYYQKTEVYLVRPYAENLYLDQQQPISLTGQASDSSRRILNELSIGQHIVYYEVTKSLRYYAEMAVQQGVNTLELKFSELRLPSLLNRLDIATEKTANKTEHFNYTLYGKKAEKIPFTAQLSINLTSTADIEAPDFIHDKYQAELMINNQRYEIKPYAFGHKLSNEQAQRIEPILLYQDDYHAYYYKYYVYKTTFEFEIYAVFKNQ